MSRRQVQPRRPQRGAMQSFTQVSKPLLANSRKRKNSMSDDDASALLEVHSLPKKTRIGLQTPPDTPTKLCKLALANLSISAPITALKSVKRKRTVSPCPNEAFDTPPLSPSHSVASDESEAMEEITPIQLHELKRLNAGLLAALTLHYAHHGSSTSVDIRNIIPSITKIWGKREVTLQDIRRCLGILQVPEKTRRPSRITSSFSIKDYGNGRVCIESASPRRNQGTIGPHFDELQLNSAFAKRLELAWNDWMEENTHNENGWNRFVETLPLEPLNTSSTIRKLAPLQAKRQRRLEEVLTPFKGNANASVDPLGRLVKRAKTDISPNSTIAATVDPNSLFRGKPKESSTSEPQQSTQSRSQDLLSRIRAKEVHAATLPAPLTKAERERRAALQRAEEMLEILNLLAVSKGGGVRASFPLDALVTTIQSSVRSPLSKDEILRCVKVLQSDIAPGYVSVVTFGSVVGVVVDRNRKPCVADVKNRLAANGV